MAGADFTKGPWYVTGTLRDGDHLRIREYDSDAVLATSDDGGHVDPQFALDDNVIEANARLMAAGPELLAACIWAEAALAPFSKSPAEKSGILMLRAAIAKAAIFHAEQVLS